MKSFRFHVECGVSTHSLPVDDLKYVHSLGKRRVVLRVWGLMICMTFEGTDKQQYNIQHCNFIAELVLALSKSFLERPLLLLHFDSKIPTEGDQVNGPWR